MARQRRFDEHDEYEEGEYRPRRKTSLTPLFVVLGIVGVLFLGGIAAVVFFVYTTANRYQERVAGTQMKMAETKAASMEAESQANLQSIGTALLEYHDRHTTFPPQAITDEKGEPLLSWRVAILPELGEGALFGEFHLSEPWDSPHNRRLLERMPVEYGGFDDDPYLQGTDTHYQVPVGPGTLFESTGSPTPVSNLFEMPRGRRIEDIRDGTRNTIILMDARKAVPWTKPEDISWTPGTRPALRDGPFGSTFVLFADRSTRPMPRDTDTKTLDALLTIQGGEAVFPDF